LSILENSDVYTSEIHQVCNNIIFEFKNKFNQTVVKSKNYFDLKDDYSWDSKRFKKITDSYFDKIHNIKITQAGKVKSIQKEIVNRIHQSTIDPLKEERGSLFDLKKSTDDYSLKRDLQDQINQLSPIIQEAYEEKNALIEKSKAIIDEIHILGKSYASQFNEEIKQFHRDLKEIYLEIPCTCNWKYCLSENSLGSREFKAKFGRIYNIRKRFGHHTLLSTCDLCNEYENSIPENGLILDCVGFTHLDSNNQLVNQVCNTSIYNLVISTPKCDLVKRTKIFGKEPLDPKQAIHKIVCADCEAKAKRIALEQRALNSEKKLSDKFDRKNFWESSEQLQIFSYKSKAELRKSIDQIVRTKISAKKESIFKKLDSDQKDLQAQYDKALKVALMTEVEPVTGLALAPEDLLKPQKRENPFGESKAEHLLKHLVDLGGAYVNGRWVDGDNHREEGQYNQAELRYSLGIPEFQQEESGNNQNLGNLRNQLIIPAISQPSKPSKSAKFTVQGLEYMNIVADKVQQVLQNPPKTMISFEQRGGLYYLDLEHKTKFIVDKFEHKVTLRTMYFMNDNRVFEKDLEKILVSNISPVKSNQTKEESGLSPKTNPTLVKNPAQPPKKR